MLVTPFSQIYKYRSIFFLLYITPLAYLLFSFVLSQGERWAWSFIYAFFRQSRSTIRPLKTCSTTLMCTVYYITIMLYKKKKKKKKTFGKIIVKFVVCSVLDLKLHNISILELRLSRNYL